MNSNLSNKSRGRLYALTSIACLIWLVTSLVDFSHDGTLTHWSSIFFAICIAAVVALTAWQAVIYLRADAHADDDAADDDEENASEDDPATMRADGAANDQHDTADHQTNR